MPDKEKKRPLEERVLRFIRENKLVTPGEILLVGVSGGADSTCLILVLNAIKERLGLSLHIAHLNHELRGAESEVDARHVSELAHKLTIPVTIEARDVKAYQLENRLSLEEAAREVRYTFFSELARKLGADKVAVGHTANDQVETVLMHLVRGSGTRGLSGLKPINFLKFGGNQIKVIRPLLEITRQETEEYCKNQRLTPRIDSTNLSLTTLRNRIRLELLPMLKKYNPEIEKAIIRTARIAADDIAFLDEETKKLASELTQREGDAIFLNQKKVLELPQALKHSLLRWAIGELAGDVRNLEMEHIEEIMDILGKPAGKSLSLPNSIIFINDYGRYILSKDESALSPYPPIEGEHHLKIPGETVIHGWKVKAELLKRGEIATFESDDRLVALLDYDRTGSNLSVRAIKRGDRFIPLGMNETKKVGEFLIDARVPRYLRKNIPLVVSPGQIVWVVGKRIDERVKITSKTKRVLRLQFKRTK